MAMDDKTKDLELVRSTILLAHNLGLSVVAEGVETAKAWKVLAELRCDQAQGYFIGRPMPAADFVAWHPKWIAPDLHEVSVDTVMGGLADF
jgi:EAL domain-containing protein (putative c-di-GMP-specific phosphodiesterase class I)